jgi:Hypervirulence associated proteins TUDOR domain
VSRTHQQDCQRGAGRPDQPKSAIMKRHFKVGDHVAWNSEAGRVTGTIIKEITTEIAFKGYKVHASEEDPQYLIKSDKTDHEAMHKGPALTKIQKRDKNHTVSAPQKKS